MSILSTYKEFWNQYRDNTVNTDLYMIIEGHIRFKEPTYKRVVAFHEGHVTISLEDGAIKDVSIHSLLIPDKKT